MKACVENSKSGHKLVHNACAEGLPQSLTESVVTND